MLHILPLYLSLNLPSFENLSIGPELPIPLGLHNMIEYGNDLVVIGGDSTNGQCLKSIYRLSCERWSCQWTEMEQKLSMLRKNFVSIPLLDSIVTCN